MTFHSIAWNYGGSPLRPGPDLPSTRALPPTTRRSVMTKSSLSDSALPPIVSAKDWAAAHEAMLIKEKAMTRARDALAAERRRMPMTPVETDYRFRGPDGEVGLLDLFAGRR